MYELVTATDVSVRIVMNHSPKIVVATQFVSEHVEEDTASAVLFAESP